MANIFQIMGFLGLILITVGVITRKRKYEDMFYIIGGICLETYSIHIGDIIFIILQIVFVLAAVYDLVRLQFFKK